MSKHGKKYQKAAEGLVKGQVIPVNSALQKVKELAYAKFDESVDVHVNLSIDAGKGDQNVRGSLVLPHARAAAPRVIVLLKAIIGMAAEKAGADFVGADDLIEKISAGWMDFDYAVATPDVMGLVGKLAKQLGPRGLLPNKKLGTVTFDVASIVTDLKKGRVFFKNDKNGIVHFSFGKVSFDAKKLQENLAAFVKALVAAKPAASKGKYLKKMTVASTMGVGLQINPEEALHS